MPRKRKENIIVLFMPVQCEGKKAEMILLFRSPAQVTKRAKKKLVIFFPYFLLPSPPPILRRPFCWTEEGSFWCCHLASAAGRESDPHLSLLSPPRFD